MSHPIINDEFNHYWEKIRGISDIEAKTHKSWISEVRDDGEEYERLSPEVALKALNYLQRMSDFAGDTWHEPHLVEGDSGNIVCEWEHATTNKFITIYFDKDDVFALWGDSNSNSPIHDLSGVSIGRAALLYGWMCSDK